jgi:hypothetical protein
LPHKAHNLWQRRRTYDAAAMLYALLVGAKTDGTPYAALHGVRLSRSDTARAQVQSASPLAVLRERAMELVQSGAGFEPAAYAFDRSAQALAKMGFRPDDIVHGIVPVCLARAVARLYIAGEDMAPDNERRLRCQIRLGGVVAACDNQANKCARAAQRKSGPRNLASIVRGISATDDGDSDIDTSADAASDDDGGSGRDDSDHADYDDDDDLNSGDSDHDDDGGYGAYDQDHGRDRRHTALYNSGALGYSYREIDGRRGHVFGANGDADSDAQADDDDGTDNDDDDDDDEEEEEEEVGANDGDDFISRGVYGSHRNAQRQMDGLDSNEEDDADVGDETASDSEGDLDAHRKRHNGRFVSGLHTYEPGARRLKAREDDGVVGLACLNLSDETELGAAQSLLECVGRGPLSRLLSAVVDTYAVWPAPGALHRTPAIASNFARGSLLAVSTARRLLRAVIADDARAVSSLCMAGAALVLWPLALARGCGDGQLVVDGESAVVAPCGVRDRHRRPTLRGSSEQAGPWRASLACSDLASAVDVDSLIQASLLRDPMPLAEIAVACGAANVLAALAHQLVARDGTPRLPDARHDPWRDMGVPCGTLGLIELAVRLNFAQRHVVGYDRRACDELTLLERLPLGAGGAAVLTRILLEPLVRSRGVVAVARTAPGPLALEPAATGRDSPIAVLVDAVCRAHEQGRLVAALREAGDAAWRDPLLVLLEAGCRVRVAARAVGFGATAQTRAHAAPTVLDVVEHAARRASKELASVRRQSRDLSMRRPWAPADDGSRGNIGITGGRDADSARGSFVLDTPLRANARGRLGSGPGDGDDSADHSHYDGEYEDEDEDDDGPDDRAQGVARADQKRIEAASAFAHVTRRIYQLCSAQ